MNRHTKTEEQTLESEYKKIFVENLKLEKELAEMRSQFNRIKSQEEEIKKLHDNTRKLKHDIRNHLMIVTNFLNDNEPDEARAYTSQILDQLNLEYSYLASGNAVLNYIINDKLNKASIEKVQIKLEVENIFFNSLNSIDFSALLGNLLDNAIEAAKNSSQRFVEIAINKSRGYDRIRVRNTTKSAVLINNPTLQSTKEDKASHGIGFCQIREIVSKYEGILDIYEESGLFTVDVLFLSV